MTLPPGRARLTARPEPTKRAACTVDRIARVRVSELGVCRRVANLLRDVECRDRAAKTLQLQVSEVFEPRHRFDRSGDTAADQDLPVLGLSTKTGGDIAHGADCGVAGAFGKSDLAQRRIALRDAGAKPKHRGHARAKRRSACRPPRASPPPS